MKDDPQVADGTMFVARQPWYFRTLLAAGSLIVLYASTGLPTLWDENPVYAVGFVVLAVALLPVGLLHVFLSRTEFGENEIGHRNAFGKKWYRKYSDIDEVKYSGSNLRLRFSDGIVLVVARTDGDLVAVGDHVIEQAGLESEFPDVDPKHLAVGTWIRRS